MAKVTRTNPKVDPTVLAAENFVGATIANLRLNWRTCGIVFVFLFALVLAKEVVQQNTIGGGIPDAIAWSFFVGPIIRTAITGEIGSKTADSKPGMWLRLFALGLLSYVPTTAIAIYLQLSGSVPLISVLGISLIVILGGFFGCFVAAFLGTWIVPPAIDEDRSFVKASKRGFSTWRYSLPRLLGLPFILNTFWGIALAVGASKLPTGDILSKQTFVHLPELVFFVVVTAAQIPITAMAIIIVARSYLQAKKLEDVTFAR